MRGNTMHSAWFKGLKTKEEKDRRKQEIISHSTFIEDLKELLQTEFRKDKFEDYDSPSWAYKQADLNGYNRALTKVLSILNIEEKQ